MNAAPSSARLGTALRGTMMSAMAETLALPCGLIIVVVLGRILGPEKYGLYAAPVALVLWIEWSLSAPVAGAIVRTVNASEAPHHVTAAVVRLHLLVGLIAAAVAALLLQLLVRWLDTPQLEGMALLALYLVPAPVVNSARSCLNGLARYRSVALLRSVRWIGRVAFLPTTVLLGGGVQELFIMMLVVVLLELATAAALLHSVMPSIVRPRRTRSSNDDGAWSAKQLLGELARHRHFVAANIMINATVTIDLLIVGGIDASLAGYYAAARNIAILPTILMPAYLPLVQNEMARTAPAQRGQTGFNLLRAPLLTLPFLALAAGKSEGLIVATYGEAYADGATIMSMLLLSSAAFLVLSTCAGILLGLGEGKRVLRPAAVTLLTSLLGMAILVPLARGEGASAAVLLAFLLGSVLLLRRVQAIMPDAIPRACAIRSLLLGLVGFVIGLAIPMLGAWETLAVLALLMLAMAAVIAWLELSRGERQFLRQLPSLRSSDARASA